jgi:hypothetical protein
MTNIIEILSNLNADDKNRYDNARAIMRKAFLTAHNLILGIENWSTGDDEVFDWIDRSLIEMMKASGRLKTAKTDIDVAVERVENDLADVIKNQPRDLDRNGAWGKM